VERQTSTGDRLVELHELICPGCRDEVADGPDGLTHVDGSPLCGGEPVEMTR
jgi:hypothetical protein